MFGNRLAELLALGGIGNAIGDQPLGNADAHCGDVQPAPVEHAHRDLETLALGAQPVGGGHGHVVEDHVGDLRALLPHLLFGAADAQARQVARHQKGGDAARARFVAGPRHHREQVRLVGIGDVALGPREAVDVAILHRARFHGARITADIGFGEREAGDDLAARDARQPLRLLLGRARHHEALAADADIGAEGGAEGGGSAPQLDRDAALLDHAEPEAAIFLGDREPVQAERAHLRDDRARDFIGLFDDSLERAQLFAHEAPHGFDQLVENVGVECHRASLP